MPARTRHLAFGDVAAVWAMLTELGVVAIVDEVVGPGPAGLPLLAGHLSGAGGAEPGGRAVFEARVRGLVGEHRRGPVHQDRRSRAGSPPVLGRDARGRRRGAGADRGEVAPRLIAVFGLDVSSVALDMTNFATYIDTANDKAPIAQRGKAKQKRSDLRLVGLGLVVTRDGGIPLLSHAYPGNKPDVTQFPAMIDTLRQRYRAIAAAAGHPADAEMTVVFDAGQNCEGNFAQLADTRLHYVGSVPVSDCPDLLALPATARSIVDTDRFAGLTALDTRRTVYGTDRRAMLTHSPELHERQARGFTYTTLAKAGRRLDELAATLARGRARRPRDQVEAEITTICGDTWVRRVVDWQLTGEQPPPSSG